MLVHRWAILRKIMRPNVAFRKTTALSYALRKLHNYCVDENDLDLHEQIKMDMFCSTVSGAIPMEDNSGDNVFPE